MEEINMEDVRKGDEIIMGLMAERFMLCDSLEFALEKTLLSTHPYSTHPNYWPESVEVADKWELPAALRGRYNAASGCEVSKCGFFPEICCAWASVDNSLFLWRYDEGCRDEKCLEYIAGEEVICVVGLSICKASIFDEAIQYLLVLATPTEVILIGVSCPRTTRDSELSLHPLPDYRISSDGIAMTCITCTDSGCILLGGCDGHIYEVQYTPGSLWQKNCRKVCLTSDLSGAILRCVVPDIFGFNTIDPIQDIVFDNERNLLYVRTDAMNLKVFELGHNGVLTKVGEEISFVRSKAREPPQPFIVSMSPISTYESVTLKLVVILSDGRRMYYRTYVDDYQKPHVDDFQKPNCLNLVSIRPCPPVGVLGDVFCADFSYYSAGTTVFSDSSSLVIVSKDYSTRPSRSGNIGILVYGKHALWESVSCFPVEGRILVVADVLPVPDIALTLHSIYIKGFYGSSAESLPALVKATSRIWSRRDLSLHHMLPRRRVVVFSTTGMMELIFNRPIDILKRLLETNSPKEALEYFFNHFGAAEAAAMCLTLAAKIDIHEDFIGGMVVDKAIEIYENPRFARLPQLEEDKLVFSGAYEGLCFCSTRLLGTIWTTSCMDIESDFSKKCKRQNIVWRMSVGAMRFLENKLRSLERFLRSRKIKKRGLYAAVDDLADLEVGKATECLRQLLLRSSEALFLLRLLSKHDVAHLFQSFDSKLRSRLMNMEFYELVSSERGHTLATWLISALMEHCTGRGGDTVDDIIGELSKGCPSYYKKKNYKFCAAMKCLDRAALSSNVEEKENLAREALNFLNQVPIFAGLDTICRKFERLRFYEAVVQLPLQSAQALDFGGGANNEEIDQASRDFDLAQRESCYEVIVIALRNLKEEEMERDFGSPSICQSARSFLDQSPRTKYICQIVQLAVQSTDRRFHQYLYRSMIDMSLEDELLEYAGAELVPFLRHAISEPRNEVKAVSASTQVKYSYLLARYYAMKREHLLAANVFLQLAERRSAGGRDAPNLEERYQCLTNALLQAKNIGDENLNCTSKGVSDDSLFHLVEEKLAVLHFQIKIKKEFESILDHSESGQNDGIPERCEALPASRLKEKLKQLSFERKTITQLYDDYAVPFELWEVCLEMLHFGVHTGDAYRNAIKESWDKLIDQSLSRGGIGEACSVMKRLGSHFYPCDGDMLPLDALCLHLEKTALETCLDDGVGDEVVPRALISTCNGATEAVLNTYNHLLSNASISTSLRLRLLRSVLVILRESAMFAQQYATTAGVSRDIRDQITTAANRYADEIQRLPLPQSQTEAVHEGFKELRRLLTIPNGIIS